MTIIAGLRREAKKVFTWKLSGILTQSNSRLTGPADNQQVFNKLLNWYASCMEYRTGTYWTSRAATMQILTKFLLTTSAVVIFVFASMGSASATLILCDTNTSINHMKIDDSEVLACLDSGTGTLTGNPANDLFLNSSAGAGFELASKSDEANPFNIVFSQTNGTGTWSFDASFWDNYSEGALAFKFGTGNEADEWFVFSLVFGATSGVWEFFNVFGKGGGLSHVNLYGIPEPSTLALLGIGLVLIALRRRRRV